MTPQVDITNNILLIRSPCAVAGPVNDLQIEAGLMFAAAPPVSDQRSDIGYTSQRLLGRPGVLGNVERQVVTLASRVGQTEQRSLKISFR